MRNIALHITKNRKNCRCWVSTSSPHWPPTAGRFSFRLEF